MEIHSVVSRMKQADRRVDTFNIIWLLCATMQNTNNGGPRPPPQYTNSNIITNN